MNSEIACKRQEWDEVREHFGLLVSIHPVGWTCDKPILFRTEIHDSHGRCLKSIGLFTSADAARKAGAEWCERRS